MKSLSKRLARGLFSERFVWGLLRWCVYEDLYWEVCVRKLTDSKICVWTFGGLYWKVCVETFTESRVWTSTETQTLGLSCKDLFMSLAWAVSPWTYLTWSWHIPGFLNALCPAFYRHLVCVHRFWSSFCFTLTQILWMRVLVMLVFLTKTNRTCVSDSQQEVRVFFSGMCILCRPLVRSLKRNWWTRVTEIGRRHAKYGSVEFRHGKVKMAWNRYKEQFIKLGCHLLHCSYLLCAKHQGVFISSNSRSKSTLISAV